MTTKDDVFNLLQTASHLNSISEFVSGQAMAEKLGVSRASVWKAIQSLQNDGVEIEAVRNRGYRLVGQQDILTLSGVSDALSNAVRDRTTLKVVKSTGSTNDDVRALALDGAPEFSVVVAGEQTTGRGRRGRPFYSLGESGVYLSILLKPEWPVDDASFITGAAAVAVCRAVDSVTGIEASIKWVNDVYLSSRKICGILTEGVADFESGGLSFAVLGIGVNVYTPESGFPEEYSQRAGSVLDKKQSNMRNRIAGSIIQNFAELYYGNTQQQARDNISNNGDESYTLKTPEEFRRAFMEEYKSRSFLPGKDIAVLKNASEEQPARALEVDDDMSLVVRMADGSIQHLKSGEVSIRVPVDN